MRKRADILVMASDEVFPIVRRPRHVLPIMKRAEAGTATTSKAVQ